MRVEADLAEKEGSEVSGVRWAGKGEVMRVSRADDPTVKSGIVDQSIPGKKMIDSLPEMGGWRYSRRSDRFD